MDVEEFIKTTLRQVHSAIQAVDEESVAENPVQLNRSKGIEFDLAVTAESTGGTSKKAGLKVHVLNAGYDKKDISKESSVSRIKFTVY